MGVLCSSSSSITVGVVPCDEFDIDLDLVIGPFRLKSAVQAVGVDVGDVVGLRRKGVVNVDQNVGLFVGGSGGVTSLSSSFLLSLTTLAGMAIGSS